MKNRCLCLWAQAALDLLQLAKHSCLENGTSLPASCLHLCDHSPPGERTIAGESLIFFFLINTTYYSTGQPRFPKIPIMNQYRVVGCRMHCQDRKNRVEKRNKKRKKMSVGHTCSRNTQPSLLLSHSFGHGKKPKERKMERRGNQVIKEEKLLPSLPCQ